MKTSIWTDDTIGWTDWKIGRLSLPRYLYHKVGAYPVCSAGPDDWCHSGGQDCAAALHAPYLTRLHSQWAMEGVQCLQKLKQNMTQTMNVASCVQVAMLTINLEVDRTRVHQSYTLKCITTHRMQCPRSIRPLVSHQLSNTSFKCMTPTIIWCT